MKKRTLARFQAIIVWWIVFYLLLFIITKFAFRYSDTDSMIKIMVYIIHVPLALFLSVAFYYISFKISILTGANKYYKYYIELNETNTLSNETINVLVSDFNSDISTGKKNEIIYLLSTYYISKANPKEAIKYLKLYDTENNKGVKWSVSDKMLRVSYVINYLGALLFIDDLNSAKLIYEDYHELLNEFIDAEEQGTQIRCLLAEYHLKFLDGINVLKALDKVSDYDNNELKIVIACDKALAYKILNKSDEEQHWLNLAYGYCENDIHRDMINKMCDDVNKRINEFTQQN